MKTASQLRSKRIESHPDFNVRYCDGDVHFLLGGKHGECEPLRIQLPHYVHLRAGSDVKRELNKWCEGFYSCGRAGEHFWFELLGDAFQARVVFGYVED